MTAALDTVRTREQAPATAQDVIVGMRKHIAQALPKGMDADRVARLALTCIRKDRALAECAPESFVGALLTASALGLDVGINGEAYLVAYKRECTLIIGYQGMSKLYFQHPLAQSLSAEAVYENDDFDWQRGTEPYLHHKPAMTDRGKVIAFYAVATLSTGASAFVVLSPEDVAALRKTAQQPRIADPMMWMQRKTCLRQLFKLLPKSTTLASAITAEDSTGTELQRGLVAQRALPAGDEPPTDQSTGEVFANADTSWPEKAQAPA